MQLYRAGRDGLTDRKLTLRQVAEIRSTLYSGEVAGNPKWNLR